MYCPVAPYPAPPDINKNPDDDLQPLPFPKVNEMEGVTVQFQPNKRGGLLYPLPVDDKITE